MGIEEFRQSVIEILCENGDCIDAEPIAQMIVEEVQLFMEQESCPECHTDNVCKNCMNCGAVWR